MKRLLAAFLALTLLLSLSACAIPLFTETYSNPTESTFRTESPDGLPPGIYFIPYRITTTDEITGDIYTTEYIQSATGNGPIPDGRVYTVESPDGSEKELRREEWLLDENYNMISHTVTIGSETVNYTYELTYNDNAQLTGKICCSGGAAVYSEEYTYDDAGNTTSVIRCTGNVLDFRREMVYDENGRLLTEIAYDGSGSITERKEHSYDDAKLSDTITVFDGSGTCIGRQVDYSNPGGYISQTLLYSPDDTLLHTIAYLPSKYTVYD